MRQRKKKEKTKDIYYCLYFIIHAGAFDAVSSHYIRYCIVCGHGGTSRGFNDQIVVQVDSGRESRLHI